MPALQSLLINSIWVIGLAGALATLNYVDWYRGIRGWTWGETIRRPLMLAPLMLSLCCFCAGVLLSEVFFLPPTLKSFASLWKPLLWFLLTTVFAIQTTNNMLAGFRRGWDIPIDES